MSWTSDRARVAALSRSREKTDPDLVSARLRLESKRPEHRFGKLINNLTQSLNEFAPLSEAQITSLKNLLEEFSKIRGAR